MLNNKERKRDARLALQAYRYRYMLHRLKEIYAEAKHFKKTHNELMQDLNEWKQEDKYKKLSVAQMNMLVGYNQALAEFMYRHDLEWRLQLPNGTWKKNYPYSKYPNSMPVGAYFWRKTEKRYN